jgi:hypothetical protein
MRRMLPSVLDETRWVTVDLGGKIVKLKQGKVWEGDGPWSSSHM